MDHDQAVYLTGLVLIFGGLIGLGAFAGLRVAFGHATHQLTCTTGSECITLLQILNVEAQKLGAAGFVAIVCGGLAVWTRQQGASE